MRGQNSLVSIIITKETKLSLREQLHRTLGTLLSPFSGLVIIEVPPPCPTPPPFSTDNPLLLHQQPLGHSSGPFPGFRHWITPPCPPTLFNPSLSTLNYDNTTVLNDAMEIRSRKIYTRQCSSFYKVPYRTIMNITTALESIQEQWVTPMVENDNQQQIYRWVRKCILLPLCIVYYTFVNQLKE